MATPTILVTNDDGYESLGIIALAEALRELGNVIVVAPDTDNSGIGHQVTVKAPVRALPVRDRAVTTYRCSGTPADCVVIGAFDLCGTMPDLLVSGINRGANAGDDLAYSGTVAAALEGTIIGIPSLAISLAANWPEQARHHHWESATGIAVGLAREALGGALPPLTLLNVNVPNVPANEIPGIRWTAQGRKRYGDRIDKRTDPRGIAYYWLWGTFDPGQITSDTDLAAIRDGYASITPVTIDRTDHAMLAARRGPENPKP